MRYFIAIVHRGQGGAYGLTFSDLLGAFDPTQ